MEIGKNVISTTYVDTDFVSLAEAKSWLRRNDTTLDDDTITMLISTAIRVVSDLIGYEIKKTLVNYGYDRFTGDYSGNFIDVNGRSVIVPGGNKLRIPAKVDSIEQVSYVNTDGTLVEFDDSDWIQDPILMGNSGYSLTFVNTSVPVTTSDLKYVVKVYEGFTPETFPTDLKSNCLLYINQLYDNRQVNVIGATVNEMPFGFWTIISNHKVYALR